MTARWIDLGHAPALALRAGYVGELGWEFHVPTEYVRDLYDRLHAAGRDVAAARHRADTGAASPLVPTPARACAMSATGR